MGIGYLGPKGTFTYQAARKFSFVDDELMPAESTHHAFSLLEENEVDSIILPIENSIEGDVTHTTDQLTFSDSEFYIEGEVVLPIKFSFYVRDGVSIDEVQSVSSHPYALGQCERFIDKYDFRTQETESTARACSDLVDSGQMETGAIAAQGLTELFPELNEIEVDIQDNESAKTRFIQVGDSFCSISENAEKPKFSLVLAPKYDRPGTLFAVLEHFADADINLSRIESKPIGGELGHYCFWIDIEAHIHSEEVEASLDQISKNDIGMKYLGCYQTAFLEEENEYLRPSDYIPNLVFDRKDFR